MSGAGVFCGEGNPGKIMRHARRQFISAHWYFDLRHGRAIFIHDIDFTGAGAIRSKEDPLPVWCPAGSDVATLMGQLLLVTAIRFDGIDLKTAAGICRRKHDRTSPRGVSRRWAPRAPHKTGDEYCDRRVVYSADAVHGRSASFLGLAQRPAAEPPRLSAAGSSVWLGGFPWPAGQSVLARRASDQPHHAMPDDPQENVARGDSHDGRESPRVGAPLREPRHVPIVPWWTDQRPNDH